MGGLATRAASELWTAAILHIISPKRSAADMRVPRDYSRKGPESASKSIWEISVHLIQFRPVRLRLGHQHQSVGSLRPAVFVVTLINP